MTLCTDQQTTGVYVYINGNFGLLTVAHHRCNGVVPKGYVHVPLEDISVSAQCGKWALNMSDPIDSGIGTTAVALGYTTGSTLDAWQGMVTGKEYSNEICNAPINDCSYRSSPTYRIKALQTSGMSGAL